jgi:catechol 2,3-dioxygenase-like lactoylglutathione lyase family enzyme
MKKTAAAASPSVAAMLDAITHTQVWVLDQDEALEFYVGQLGLEVTNDVDLGFMRWLTVNVPGHPETELVLLEPCAPALDDATAEQVRELVAKGALVSVIFRTSDCRGTYDALRSRGVEFSQQPEERFYGIDCALRDPSGNQVRITEPAPNPVVPQPAS